jgi:hypothetical protein
MSAIATDRELATGISGHLSRVRVTDLGCGLVVDFFNLLLTSSKYHPRPD